MNITELIMNPLPASIRTEEDTRTRFIRYTSLKIESACSVKLPSDSLDRLTNDSGWYDAEFAKLEGRALFFIEYHKRLKDGTSCFVWRQTQIDGIRIDEGNPLHYRIPVSIECESVLGIQDAERQKNEKEAKANEKKERWAGWMRGLLERSDIESDPSLTCKKLSIPSFETLSELLDEIFKNEKQSKRQIYHARKNAVGVWNAPAETDRHFDQLIRLRTNVNERIHGNPVQAQIKAINERPPVVTIPDYMKD